MTDHPRIPLAGVIGSPIAHSLSPRLHGHWLKTYGIAGYYIPMDVAGDDLETVLRALPKAGFVGCNVTIPHKEAVLALADVVTDRAALIGAARRGLAARADAPLWTRLQLTGMRGDFSWRLSARAYEQLYRDAIAEASGVIPAA